MTDISRQIEAQIPRLRRYAMALTRDAAAADDLVQDCMVRALSKQHLWKEGTDVRAWLFTILHNQYVNTIRRSARESAAVAVDDIESSLTCEACQGERLKIRDLDRALAKIPHGQRAAILLVGAEGLTYGTAAELLGVPAGTVRSRISRGRETLRDLTHRRGP